MIFRMLLSSLASVVIGVGLTTQVNAQAIGLGDKFRGTSLTEGREKLLTEGAARKFSSDAGVFLAPGIVVQSSLSTEVGYDTNPDDLFGDDTPGAYGAARASSRVGFLSERGVTTIGFLGGRTPYQGDDVIDPSRWDFGVAFDNNYRLAPGWEIGGGAFFVRDHQYLIPSDNTGGYAQVTYLTEEFEYNSVARVDDIAYTEESPFLATLPPIFQPFARSGEYDVRRIESFSNVHFGKNRMLGVYAEAGYADLNYTTQRLEAFLDRDATETWTLAGVRYTSPDKTVIADVGWRFNWRDIDTLVIGQRGGTVDNNYFDAKIIWVPNNYFQTIIDVDRKFVEPWTLFAVAAVQTTYSAETIITLAPDWQLSNYTHFREYEQIGDIFNYEELFAGTQISHQLTPNISVYGLVNYKLLTETTTDEDAERIRVGVGTRVAF